MRDSAASLLFSIRPRYAEQILAGTKTVELRRVRPNVQADCPVLIYASSPVMELVGIAKVRAVHTGSLEAMWSQYGHVSGVDRETFDNYFDGLEQAVVVELYAVERLRRGVPLLELRRRVSGFRPPQSFRYLGPADAAAVLVAAA